MPTATKPIKDQPQAFPSIGLVRVKQILTIIPVGASTWHRWVREGKAPKPFKLSENTTVWKAEDIHAFVEKMCKTGAAE